MSSNPISNQQISEELGKLNGWSFKDDAIHISFTFDDFRSAMAFLVRVGFEAEELGHHPEIKNVYNRVEISLSTHDAGNKVTEKDFSLAKRIDKLAK